MRARDFPYLILWSCLALTLAITLASKPQRVNAQSRSLVEMSMDAAGIGYDGYFRAGQWLPLQVHLTNYSEIALNATLVVRPQTSPASVASTFSAPVHLPAEMGSRIQVTLYIQPLARARLLRLELLLNEGEVIAQQNFRLQPVAPQDHLHMIISDAQSPAPLSLKSVRNGSSQVRQGAWSVEQIPERAAALDGLDLLLISNSDTGVMNAAQRAALAAWVARGGTLIVTGSNTAARSLRTAVGLSDLLPITLEGNHEISNLSALAQWLGDDATLSDNTSIARGKIHPQARVLLESADGEPLILQREFGEGMVNYLTADPLALPLANWTKMGEVWFNLALSANPRPGWDFGWLDWEAATSATEIMPGLELLPNTLSILMFLVTYIVTVGPLNYGLLSTLRRREWAWLSIPAFILSFAIAAWLLGQQLRGTAVTLNQITIVRAWPEVHQARVDQLLGLLSPRREQLSIDIPPDTLIGAFPREQDENVLSLNTDASLNIEESGVFRASNFAVDAGLVRQFVLTGVVALPALDGQATLQYQADGRGQSIWGNIHNRSELALEQPVLLFRHHALALEEPLAPGESREFQLTLPNAYEERDPSGASSPSRLVYTPDLRDEFSSRGFSRRNRDGETSTRQLLGFAYENSQNRQNYNDETAKWQRDLRRRLLLEAVMDDHARAPGRGNQLYLAGWQANAIHELQLRGADYRTQAETLYLIELPLEFQQPSGPVTIAPEQFTWHSPLSTAADIGPQRFTLRSQDELVFEYLPLPEARLATIDAMRFVIRIPTTIIHRQDLQIWDWQREIWDTYTVDIGPSTASTEIRENLSRYLGPLQRVRLHLAQEENDGFFNINVLGVEFSGRYASEETKWPSGTPWEVQG